MNREPQTTAIVAPGREAAESEREASVWAGADSRLSIAAPLEAHQRATRLPGSAREEGAHGSEWLPAPPSARRVVDRPGMPLDPRIRREMEQRLGHDFSSVRVHVDVSADAAAKELGARSFASGSHIVFAAGEYALHTHEGRELIEHELTHVVRQTRRGQRAGSLVQLQPSPVPTNSQPPAAGTAAPNRKAAEIREDLTFSRRSNRSEIPKYVKELLEYAETRGDDVELLRHGMDEVKQLADDGDIISSTRLMRALKNRVLGAFDAGHPLPTQDLGIGVGGFYLGDPRSLIGLAEGSAHAGDHDRAVELFEAAHLILTVYAHRITAEASTSSSGDFASRHTRYTQLKAVFAEMRDIYRFYSILEVEALERNDLVAANDARGRARNLERRLTRQFTVEPDKDIAVAETSQVQTSKGPAFRFHGTNYESLDLTALPGHPFSAQTLSSQEALATDSLKEVQEAVVGQSAFQAEISYEPEVRKAFTKADVNVNDEAQRLKLWRVMYGVYARRGGNPLARLMSLIGRYLKAYAFHTSFNVRDFGKSYLDTPFPSDVAGRLVHDCGVYALRVAWDVFRTVKAEDSKLKVSFTLATLLDHIVLIVKDETVGEFYLVNNDLITRYEKLPPPSTFGPSVQRPKNLPERIRLHYEDPPYQPPPVLKQDEDKREEDRRNELIGEQYMKVRTLPFLVTPASYMDIGTTKDSQAAFKSKTWSKYLATTSFMAQVPVNFQHLEAFSLESEMFNARIDGLLPLANDAGALQQFLNDQEQGAILMLQALGKTGIGSFNDVPQGIPVPQGMKKGASFRWAGSNHPLVRFALIMVRVQKLGGQLSSNQQIFLDKFNDKFKKLMNDSHANAEQGLF